VAGADIRRLSGDRRNTGAAIVRDVISSALIALADAAIFPTLVLVAFAAQLTDDLVTIGLVPAMSAGLWFLPQLLARPLTHLTNRQVPWMTGAAIIRAAAVVLLAVIGFRDDLSNTQRLRSLLICYAAFVLASGFAAVPAKELVQRAIPPDQRSWFLRVRNLWAIAGGAVAAVLVFRVLGPEGPAFPKNFAYLFVVAAAALIAAVFFQAREREPATLPSDRLPLQGSTALNAARALLDTNFRRFLTFRIFAALSTLADPFVILYAFRELNTPLWAIGPYLAALIFARLCIAPLWSAIATRAGHRAVLQGAALARLLAPLVTLLLPFLADSSLYQNRFSDLRPLWYAFGIVFVLHGASLAGQSNSTFAYLLDIAPADRRFAYIWMTNVILMVTAFAPLAGGYIIERSGFDRVFIVAALASLTAILASGLLTDTHTRTRAVAQTWRLRGARS
jgi:MFS family permease